MALTQSLTTTTTTTTPDAAATTSTKFVCFSFAAYAKSVIDHLKSLNIPVLSGLTDPEFTSIETTFHFSFPPDLRSILQEGLPIGPYFPNWRDSSLQQLQILLNLPSLNLSKNVVQNDFWVDSWGHKPDDSKQSMDLAKGLLEKAPILVPIFRNCYIPSSPNIAGNPVFYVDDGNARVLSFDVTRFYQEFEFLQLGFKDVFWPVRKENVSFNVPAWAATAARRVEFWTDVVERGRRGNAREPTGGWWSGEGEDLDVDQCELRDCLERAFWRLRDGGWKEEDVRDMMMMDGCNRVGDKGWVRFDKENEMWHVRVLLRAGWSREDVVYSLNLQGDGDVTNAAAASTLFDGASVSCLEFKPSTQA